VEVIANPFVEKRYDNNFNGSTQQISRHFLGNAPIDDCQSKRGGSVDECYHQQQNPAPQGTASFDGTIAENKSRNETKWNNGKAGVPAK